MPLELHEATWHGQTRRAAAFGELREVLNGILYHRLPMEDVIQGPDRGYRLPRLADAEQIPPVAAAGLI